MRYDKIRVEDGNLIFFRHMIQNNLPCRDIVWAYIHREGENAEEAVKQMISNYLVIITRRKKRYQFEMTEHEAQDCLRILKLFNTEMATRFPRADGFRCRVFPIQEILGRLPQRMGVISFRGSLFEAEIFIMLPWLISMFCRRTAS